MLREQHTNGRGRKLPRRGKLEERNRVDPAAATAKLQPTNPFIPPDAKHSRDQAALEGWISNNRVPRSTFADMSTEEIAQWLASTIEQLLRKKSRDRSYLDRRAARGTHTPTDELLEQDQFLLAEVILFLREALETAEQGDDES